jgi:hypothetical protein
MLEVAGPGISFIDGNEHGYYYAGREDFERGRTLIREGALSLIPAVLRDKYRRQVQVGAPVYPNWVIGDWPREKLGLTPPHFMSDWEQLRYLESDMFHALATTDEYVWFYNEGMDWWRAPSASGKGRMPEGLEDAVRSARHKLDAGQGLGYDIGPMLRTARNRQAAEARAVASQRPRDPKTAD